MPRRPIWRPAACRAIRMSWRRTNAWSSARPLARASPRGRCSGTANISTFIQEALLAEQRQHDTAAGHAGRGDRGAERRQRVAGSRRRPAAARAPDWEVGPFPVYAVTETRLLPGQNPHIRRVHLTERLHHEWSRQGKGSAAPVATRPLKPTEIGDAAAALLAGLFAAPSRDARADKLPRRKDERAAFPHRQALQQFPGRRSAVSRCPAAPAVPARRPRGPACPGLSTPANPRRPRRSRATGPACRCGQSRPCPACDTVRRPTRGSVRARHARNRSPRSLAAAPRPTGFPSMKARSAGPAARALDRPRVARQFRKSSWRSILRRRCRTASREALRGGGRLVRRWPPPRSGGWPAPRSAARSRYMPRSMPSRAAASGGMSAAAPGFRLVTVR